MLSERMGNQKKIFLVKKCAGSSPFMGFFLKQ
jgi:hypothetical protein